MFRTRTSLRRALVALAVTTGTVAATAPHALAVDGPAPLPVGYLSPQQLELHCALQGGSYSSDGPGGNYMCVLPSGHVIHCDYQRQSCVVLKTVPPKPRRPWTPFVDVSPLVVSGVGGGTGGIVFTRG